MLNPYLRSTLFYSFKKSLGAKPFSSLKQNITQTTVDVDVGTIKITNVPKSIYRGKSAEEAFNLHNQLKQAHFLPNSLVCVCYPTISQLIEDKPTIKTPGHIYSFAIDHTGDIVFSTHVDFLGNKDNLKILYNAELGESSREIPTNNIVKFHIKKGRFFTHKGRHIEDQKSFSKLANFADSESEYAILTLPGIYDRERTEILASMRQIVATEELGRNSADQIAGINDYIPTGGSNIDNKDIIIYPNNCITVFCQMLGWKKPHPQSRFGQNIADHLFRATPQGGLIYAIEQLYGYPAAAAVFMVLAQNPTFIRGLSRTTDYKHLLSQLDKAHDHEISPA